MKLPPKIPLADLSQFEQFKLVGRISLWFGCVALVALCVLLFTPSTPVENYAAASRTLAITQEHLLWVMLAGGLLLLVGTGITTWLITLYSSFRVAGPLYRFSRNLEVGAEVGEVPRIRIRADDQLQAESQLLEDTLTQLYGYYWDLEQQADKLLCELEQADRVDPLSLDAALRELKQLEARMQVEDHV